jgi:DNA-binding GntR family transcriptional regulator
MPRGVELSSARAHHREMAGAVEKAYTAVRERIVRGAYPPSARITEQEISDAAGVSRTPAREALRRLQAEGFVRVVPNQGAIVTEWTEGDIEDIFELRAMLESYGAARAAQRITEAGVAELKRLAMEQHRESVRRSRGYLHRIGAINSEFHRALHRFAASPRLTTALNSLIEAPLMLQTFSSYRPEDLMRSASHHLEIVNALEARDGPWAAAVMRSHILAARVALQPKLPVAS